MMLDRLPSTLALLLGRTPAGSTAVADPRLWRRFVLFFAVAAIGLAAVMATTLLALDPYDSGRFALSGDHGVPRTGQRLAGASLGRQPGFDTAIIGNSEMQLLDPARIAPSGGHAVQLTIPGAGPREQLVVADWFRRHHAGTALLGLVIGLDFTRCRGDGKLEFVIAFPFWLYADNAFSYATGLVSLQSVDGALRKVKLLLRLAPPERQDGYNDYELGRVWDPTEIAARAARPERATAPEDANAPPPEFAAAPLLRCFLARLPDTARVVLVWPPRHRHAFPLPGTADAAIERACTTVFDAIAADHPGTRLIDFRDRRGMRDDADFWDLHHYRARVARAMETEIAAALDAAR